ncbi:MAG: diacylglycerol kinase family lipid kinase [Chloroflexota bacterium]
MALVADLWQARGWRVIIQPTQAPGHATELARQAAAAGHQLVFAAGGDGTLGDVANGLAGTETIMAPLPVGTANSFARELNMPLPLFRGRHQLLKCADLLLNGRIHAMDLGYTTDAAGNGRHWLLWSGAGADGYLVEHIEPRPKWSKKLGRLGYMVQGIALSATFPTVEARIEIDGRLFEDHYLLALVSNCRLYAGGGITISPQARLDDGLFEVWLFQGKHIYKMFQYGALMKAGRREYPGMELVYGRSITIHTNPTHALPDRRRTSGHTPITCTLQPGALRLLVPASAPEDYFQKPGLPFKDFFNP